MVCRLDQGLFISEGHGQPRYDQRRTTRSMPRLSATSSDETLGQPVRRTGAGNSPPAQTPSDPGEERHELGPMPRPGRVNAASRNRKATISPAPPRTKAIYETIRHRQSADQPQPGRPPAAHPDAAPLRRTQGRPNGCFTGSGTSASNLNAITLRRELELTQTGKEGQFHIRDGRHSPPRRRALSAI